ncbi:MAG TPA: peptidoglycan DD-metalloendopeptidase family protein [Puia sp.]|nr:peptidoglycan DD-metalloendopeptidase family protein [Puia sp.]
MLKSALASLLLICLAAGSFCQSPAQSRNDLERERAAIQKEIEDVKRSLDETKKNKKETLGQLALVQRRLRLRESAVQNINKQINFIQNDMNQSWQEILKLRRELDTLRKQYEESVVYAYENRTNYDFLNFIFSASSFNDALKRVSYLKSYRAYREEEAANIQKTQQMLQGKIDGLRLKRQVKDEVLQKQNKEKKVLEDEKKEKDAIVFKLQSREKELKKEMAAKQKQDQRLNGAIAAALRRARDEAIRETNTKKAADAKANPKENRNSSPSNPEPPASFAPKTAAKAVTVFDSRADLAMSDNFEKNKGRLPWPVDAGNVSMHFGLQSYVNLKYNNQGITIEAQQGTFVKAIFEGEVQSVFNVGDVNAVMIRHGKYFTTYSNLESVSIAKGQKIRTGQILGRVSEIGQLEFVLSDEKDHKFDPEKWLRR